MNTLPHALIVAGPTASGKSALALAIAERLGGTIINTDSMQVYRELRVLTARPDPEEEARVPHRLYGIRPAAEAGSVAWWRDQALSAMAGSTGRRPAAHPDRRIRHVLRRADRWTGRDPRSRPGCARRSPPSAGRTRSERAACQPGPCRSRHRRPPEARRQPAHRPRMGSLARHWRRPCRLAEPPRPTRAMALHRDPARSAARRVACRDRHPLRHHDAQRRTG